MSDEFSVNDKRLFSRDGQVNPDAKDEPGKNAAARPAFEASADEGFFPGGSHGLPPANFASLLIGLATSAFIHLGESPDPGAGEGQVDLAAAKQAIDILAVLQKKTVGNLEQEEEALLTTLLYDLRLKFIQASGSGK